MNDQMKILISSALDLAVSTKNIVAQLPELAKAVNAASKIKLDVSINTDNTVKQAQESAQNISKIIKQSSNISAINIPIQIDKTSATTLKKTLDEFARQAAELKGFDYAKVATKSNSVGSLDTATLTYYKNATKETVSEVYKFNEAENKLSLTTVNANQNIQQLTKSNERLFAQEQKVIRGKEELAKQMDIINAKANKSGVSLDTTNQAAFTSKLNNSNSIADLQETSHYLKMAKLEYQQLNAEMSKGLPQSAIENLGAKIENMGTGITMLGNKFKTLGNAVPENLDNRLNGLREDLVSIDKITNPQDKVKAYNALSESVKKLNNEYKVTAQQNRLVNQDKNLGVDKIKFLASMESWLKKNSKAAKDFGATIHGIQSEVEGADGAQLTNLQKQFQTVNKSAEAAGKTGRSFIDELKNDAGKIGMWLGSGTLIFGAIRQVKQMVSNVKDLNSAAVDLQMVTGNNSAQTSELLTQYNALAKQIGATTTEVASSGSEWLRQGKSIEDTNTLIKDAMVLSKVAKLDSADSTKYLTSATKGYNVAVEDTMGIVDKLNAVDLVSATSAGGLAEGMSRTANMANLAGVSMDKLLGYLATVGEVTQKEMSEVGTSFQNMFSRLGNVKAGKFIDDETGESLNDVEKVLNKLDIKLRDSEDTFRNFGNVFDEVGGKWKSFSEVDQNAIGTAMAGTKQRENFTVLMENYGNTLKYAETSANSSGSAMKKMEVYENSIEAATKRMTASFEAFSTQIINGDLIKGIIDFGAAGLNAITGINKHLGTLPTLAATASLALSAMGKNAGKEYAPFLRVA